MSYFSQHLLALTPDQEAGFETLYKCFTDWNQKINLSAIRDKDEVYLKHFVDSLLATKYIDFSGKKIADLGTGGGFPLLPLSLVTPNSEFHGFDSVGKKLKAVQDMADHLALRVKTFHGRLETFGQTPDFREQYDLVTTRALAHWGTLLEYALPFVRVGGTLIAYQGPQIKTQIAQDKNQIVALLGGSITHIYEETLSGDQRMIIEIQKIKPTPKKYPREVGIPKHEPLV